MPAGDTWDTIVVIKGEPREYSNPTMRRLSATSSGGGNLGILVDTEITFEPWEGTGPAADPTAAAVAANAAMLDLQSTLQDSLQKLLPADKFGPVGVYVGNTRLAKTACQRQARRGG